MVWGATRTLGLFRCRVALQPGLNCTCFTVACVAAQPLSALQFAADVSVFWGFHSSADDK